MKRIILAFFALILCFAFVGCGQNKPNTHIIAKIEKTINRTKSILNEVEVINETEIVSPALLPYKADLYTFLANQNEQQAFLQKEIAVQAEPVPYRPRNFTDSKGSFQNKNFGYSETQALRNVNTYRPVSRIRNINSFTGYGETTENAFNEIDYVQQGVVMPYTPNGYGAMPYGNAPFGTAGYGTMPYGNGNPNLIPNGNYMGQYNNGFFYGGRWRGISNVNTYGYGVNNVNTYEKALAQQKEQENMLNARNINSLNVKAEDLTSPQQTRYLQEHYQSLSNLFLSFSSTLEINNTLNAEKEYLFQMFDYMKQSLKTIKSSQSPLTQSQITSINNLLENINENLNRINMSKNEVNYEVEKIKKVKNNFIDGSDGLTSRYVLLSNILSTRYSYYSNISVCFEEVNKILLKVTNKIDIEEIYGNDREKINLEEPIKKQEITQENKEQTLEEKLLNLQKQEFENNEKQNENIQKSHPLPTPITTPEIDIENVEINNYNFPQINEQITPQPNNVIDENESTQIARNPADQPPLPEINSNLDDNIESHYNFENASVENTINNSTDFQNEHKETQSEKNTEQNQEQYNQELIDGFKKIETPPVKTSNQPNTPVQSTNRRNFPKKPYRPNITNAFEPEDKNHFTSNEFPFKNPKKFDYMKVCI
ncbi:MAG: hypothetical protein ACOX6H_00215 [Christensenellales bacterium]